MTRTRRFLVGAVAALVIFATAAAAMAQTCTLTLKRRETKSARGYADSTDYMLWSVRPQYFSVQINAQGKVKSRPVISGDKSQEEAFKRIVKKEPKYQSKYPFRGVVKLGSQEFAFALDRVASTPAPEAKKPESKPISAKGTPSPEAAGEAILSLGKLFGLYSDEQPAAKPAIPVKDFSYNRLYFDSNHNGDLTDDKVVERSADASPAAEMAPVIQSYLNFEFPRVDVTIDVEGTKLDYSFSLEGYAYAMANSCQVSVSVSSAVRREGDITLAGKRHHLVLLDYNSNGRFDDQSKISENIHLATGQLYPEQGDVLLVDPKLGNAAFDSPYDPTSSDYRYDVAKLIPIDGRWYELKISPAGDKLTLTPSTVPLGNVTNHNEAFRAIIYGDQGFLKIRGTKDKPIPVPEGKWKLLSYTITHAAQPQPAKAAEKKAEKMPVDKAAKAKKRPLLEVLAKQLVETVTGSESETPAATPSPVAAGSLVSATATEKYKAVTVRKGKTVELPFGPPYTPTVTAMSYGNPKDEPQQLFLEMSLVGVGGEGCTNMMVKGTRPGKPSFTITDPKGKVVEQGDFEYG
jgi:hypothetical protein